MDPSTSAEPLEFNDLQGQTLTKQPGQLNGFDCRAGPCLPSSSVQCCVAPSLDVGMLVMFFRLDAGRALC